MSLNLLYDSEGDSCVTKAESGQYDGSCGYWLLRYLVSDRLVSICKQHDLDECDLFPPPTTKEVVSTGEREVVDYDDSSLTGIGRESIGNGLGFFEFEFQWFGVTYREDSNPEFASRIEFHNGNFLGIRYFLGWDKPTPNFSLSLSSFSYENNPDILDAQGSVSYTMTSVPESNSVITLLGFGFFGVRVIANQRFTAKSEW